MGARRWWWAVGFLGLGCAQEAEQVGQWSGRVIVGEDGRQDVSQLPTELHAITTATAALMYAHRLTFPSADSVELEALSAADALQLCPEEAFRDQPVAAYCSGVLIDDTLLATAGHCLGDDLAQASQRCERIRVAFGYEVRDEGASAAVGAEDVFSCRRVVFLERDPGDLAIVELDRPVRGREPAKLSASRPVAGDLLTVASHGAGLPLKVEQRAEVVAAPDGAEFFVAASDTFAGGSGGGLFNDQLELAGMVLRGRADWVSDASCRRAARVELGEEQHGHTAPKISAVLAALERPSSHPAVSCGDHVCELGERESCFEDCHRYDAVPARWMDDPELWLLANPPDVATPADAGCALNGHGRGPRSLPAVAVLALWIAAFRRRAAARAPVRAPMPPNRAR